MIIEEETEAPKHCYLLNITQLVAREVGTEQMFSDSQS